MIETSVNFEEENEENSISWQLWTHGEYSLFSDNQINIANWNVYIVLKNIHEIVVTPRNLFGLFICQSIYYQRVSVDEVYLLQFHKGYMCTKPNADYIFHIENSNYNKLTTTKCK